MNWKIEGLKKFDSIFGRLACSVSRLAVSPRKWVNKDNPKILVIRPGGIGDGVLLFPALKELREEFPDSDIDILAEKRNAGILTICPSVSNIISYDINPAVTLYKTIKGNYDIVIDTEQWHRLTAAVSYLTKASLRVGFATNERANLYTQSVAYKQEDYEVYSFLNLISAVTGKEYKFDESKPFIPLDSNSHSEIVSSLSDFKKGKSGLVGVFAGATVPERRWGTNNFADLSKELSEGGLGIVLIGGKVDLEDSIKFKEIIGSENVLDYVGLTSLSQTAWIISKLDLFVTGDTGLMHISYGVGTPTVSLFGAGIEGKWAPQGGKHIAINKNLSCSPCTKFGYTPRCPYNVKCLSDIKVQEVKDAVMNILPPL